MNRGRIFTEILNDYRKGSEYLYQISHAFSILDMNLFPNTNIHNFPAVFCIKFCIQAYMI